MWHAIERFLGDPVAFAFMLVFGSITIFIIKKRDEKRRAAAEASEQTGSTKSSGSRPALETPKADGEETLNRKRQAAAIPGMRPALQPGFKDLRFGSAPLKEMFVYHEDGTSKLYVKSGDVLKLHDQPLTSVLYSYYRDKLEAVIVEMPDGAADKVLASLSQQWGVPKRPNLQTQKYFWTDLLTGDDAMQAVLEKTPLTRKAVLTVTSKAIKALKEREKTGQRSVK